MTLELEREPAAAPHAWPTSLYELTLAVAAAREPSDICDAALTCLHDTLGVERSSVLLFDGDGVMRFKAWRNLSDEYRAAVDGHSPWSANTRDAQPILVEDVRDDPALASLRETIEGEGIRALAFVPLTIGNRLLGKFMLYYAEPHRFSGPEVMIARTIAAHVGFAIDQQAHRESERRYRGLLETLGVAVYTTDAEGRITFYNEEAAALWGRSPEIGADRWCGSWRLFWSDGTPMQHDECPMAMTLKSGKPARGFEAIAEQPDGSRINFIPYPTPIIDGAGRLAGAVNVLVDITARKRAEEALNEKEQRLVAVLDAQAELLRARDETIRLYEIVQAQLASLIEASGALIGARPGKAVYPAILRNASALLGADGYAMWQFNDEHDRWEIVSADGLSQEYIAASAITDHDGQRQLEQAMVVEDVNAEDQLAFLRERYAAEGIRSIFVAPLGMGSDTNGTLTFYYRTPHRFSELEVRVGTALANLASASLTAATLFDANERARIALHGANAELKRTAAELRQANDAKDEFLGLVSHELKTPLTTIRGNAAVLFRSHDVLDDETRQAALSDIVGESERLHRIIENLLLLARAEQGQPLDTEPLIVVRIVQRVIERYRQSHPRRVFEIRESGGPRPVLFSEACLEQVMDNLISNAIKYSPESEPIVVEFERTPQEITLRVLDHGVGIGSEEAKRLFDPFYRSKQTTHKAEGLGIGLAVCKRLVEAYGGTMWAMPRPDGGSEFGFTLAATEDSGAGFD